MSLNSNDIKEREVLDHSIRIEELTNKLTEEKVSSVQQPMCIRYCRKQYVCCMTFLIAVILLIKMILDGIGQESLDIIKNFQEHFLKEMKEIDQIIEKNNKTDNTEGS